MSQSKKYTFQLKQDDSGWSVEILRRASSKKIVITKSQGGFATETEAQSWGENEVQTLIKKTNLSESQKRRAKKSE
jgi:hypothetical protein